MKWNKMKCEYWNEQTPDKTYIKICATSELRSACASAQSDQSSLIACTFYNLHAIQRRINENPCHIVLMYKLIWVFACHSSLIVGFAMCWLKYKLAIMRVTMWHLHPTMTLILMMMMMMMMMMSSGLDVSTHECHLLQNNILICFSCETAIIIMW